MPSFWLKNDTYLSLAFISWWHYSTLLDTAVKDSDYMGFLGKKRTLQVGPALHYGSNFRIPRNSFTCHWIRIASIVLCLDLQSLPTHVSEADQSCGVFWSLAPLCHGNFILACRTKFLILYNMIRSMSRSMIWSAFWSVIRSGPIQVTTDLVIAAWDNQSRIREELKNGESRCVESFR